MLRWEKINEYHWRRGRYSISCSKSFEEDDPRGVDIFIAWFKSSDHVPVLMLPDLTGVPLNERTDVRRKSFEAADEDCKAHYRAQKPRPSRPTETSQQGVLL